MNSISRPKNYVSKTSRNTTIPRINNIDFVIGDIQEYNSKVSKNWYKPVEDRKEKKERLNYNRNFKDLDVKKVRVIYSEKC